MKPIKQIPAKIEDLGEDLGKNLGEDPDLDRALDRLRQGGVVVIPTDTLYGLAADIFNEAALQKIFAIKGRPANLALPVLVSGIDQLAAVAREVSPLTRSLAEKFWPGPLTLVVPKASHLSSLLTGGGDTVAVRMPDHPVPLALARRLNSPLTGTSANASGQPDLLTLELVQEQLADAVDYIITRGPAPLGRASTIIGVCGPQPRLLREGALAYSKILAAIETG